MSASSDVGLGEFPPIQWFWSRVLVILAWDNLMNVHRYSGLGDECMMLAWDN